MNPNLKRRDKNKNEKFKEKERKGKKTFMKGSAEFIPFIKSSCLRVLNGA